MLIPSIKNSLNELVELLQQLSNDDYQCKCNALSHATIGEHTRHVIEMFQCLENFYDLGIVNYDKRDRNLLIQNDTNIAISAIVTILKNISRENKTITLQQILDGEEILIDCNPSR